jgi:hypothetical protein
MSNTRAGNVIRVDTSANFTDVRNIETIKYIGASSGTAVITKAVAAADNSGNKLYEASGTSNELAHGLEIRCPTGVYVAVSNSAVVYLYLGDC